LVLICSSISVIEGYYTLELGRGVIGEKAQVLDTKVAHLHGVDDRSDGFGTELVAIQLESLQIPTSTQREIPDQGWGALWANVAR
jgi:hypothetical protein